MYRRNFLKSGDYVTLIPLGAMITLSYNMDGILDGVMIGNSLISKNKEFLQAVKQYKTLPLKIHITNGRTEVKGVLYTSSISEYLGKIPDCLNETYIDDYIQNSRNYNFFATSFETESSSYTSSTATAMNEWLRMAGFRTIPGFVVPSDTESAEKTFKRYLVDDTSFIPGVVEYYMTYDSGVVNYISSGLCGYNVDYENVSNKVIPDVFINENGHWVSDIFLVSNDSSIHKQYGYNILAKNNIRQYSYVILNDENEIVYSSNKDSENLYSNIVCPYCGKPINVDNTDNDVMCLNPRCFSRMYPTIKHALNVLKLESMSFEEYLVEFSKFSIVAVSDILDIDKYRNVIINTTIQNLLDAIIPVSSVRNRSVIESFVGNCSNSIETIRYYISNPGEILSDIREVTTSISGNELVDWFRDSTNVAILNKFLESPNVHITLKTKEYEAAPILRGQNICLTGKFKHGSFDKVANILASYSAAVSKSLADDTSALVVGDINEDVSGVMIREAQSKNISVVSESQFFDAYDIDTDISNNLQ